MPSPVRKAFYLRSGSLRRQVGFVQDQPPDGFIVRTTCSVSGSGQESIEMTTNYAHYHDASECWEQVYKILAEGWTREAMRLLSQQAASKNES